MKNSTKILLSINILLMGAIASFFIFQKALAQESAKLSTPLPLISYADQIKTETDPYKLTVNGLNQLNRQLPDFALMTLGQSVVANKNYRDGWLSLGLAQFETKDYTNALTSFSSAQKLDPIHSQTYQLLAALYRATNQPDLAQTAQNQYDFLAQTN